MVTTRYTASDVYRLWRQGGRRALRDLPEGLELTAPRIEARTYADIADGLLSAFGPKVWGWRDARGRTAERGGLLASAINVARDLAVSPLLPRLHARRARRLQAIPDARPSPPDDAPPLYVRTDHMFDLRAGGSVAHTAGVLNAMRKLCGPVDVISTDRLALVEPDARFEVLTPRYGLGRNIPNMALLRYNTKILHGAFAVEKTPAGEIIVLRANQLADTADPLEITRVITAIAWQADKVEEKLLGGEDQH